MRTRLIRTLLVAGSVALAVPGVAAAADLRFGATQQLSPDGLVADSPRVDVDPNGNAIAAWRESVGGKWEAHVAYRAAGGFFSTPSVRLSPAGADTIPPQVAIARDGTAIVIWGQPQAGAPAGRWDVAAAVRPAGGTFGAPVILSPGTDSAYPKAVEFDDNGNAIVMITTDLGNGSVGKQRADLIHRPAGGGFSAPTPVYTTVGDANLNQDGVLDEFDIAFDGAGNAVIGFGENSYAFNQDGWISELRVFSRSANGTIELPPKLIASRHTDRSLGALQLGITGSRQVATYARSVGAGTGTLEYVTRAKTGDDWSGYRILAGDRTDPQKLASSGNLSADAAGNAIIAATDAQPPPGTPPVPREFFLPAGSRDFTAPRPHPAGVDGTGAQLKDAGDGQRYWLTQVNGAPHIWFASRGAGAAPTYGTPRDVGTVGGAPAVSVGPNGHTAVLSLVQQGLDTKVQAMFGDEPAPGAPAPPPAPPPPPPPVTNAIDAVGRVESGRPVVLSVAVTGIVSRIEWRIGNSGPYVGDGIARAIRLRVNGTQTVRAKLIGPGGTKEVSRTITGPKAPTDADARRVASGEPSSASAVIATGRPGVLSGKDAGCAQTTVYAGGRTLLGCMRPIDELSDIPAGERGVLDPLASAYKLTRSDAPLMNRAVQLLDGYLITNTLTLDGLWPVIPSGGAKLVAFPQAQALTSSNAAFRVAGQALKPGGSGFNLRLPSSAGAIALGTVPRPAALRYLGGLAYAGDFDVTLGGGYATIETNLRYPGFISRNGIPVQPRIRMYAAPDRIITENLPTLGPFDRMDFGPVPMIGVKLTYNAATDEWAGGGSACIFGAGCLEFQPPVGGLRFGGDGELVYAKTSLNYGDPGRLLAPGVFLENAGFGFGLNPSRVFGSARLGLGSFVKVDGREVFAFPSAAAPYMLRRDEVGDAFPAALYAKRFTSPLIAAGADVLVRLPVIGEQRLGGGYLLFESTGYVAMGGAASIDVLGIIRYSGSISGEYNLVGQRYNLHGDIRACLIAVDDDLCAGSVAHMSRGPGLEGGAGACLTVGPVSIGGGVLWAEPGKPKIWPLDGCKWSRFRIAIAARAAQAPTSFAMSVKAGGPSQVLRLQGAGAAPRVKVTGPGGQTLSSGDAGLAYSPDGKIRLVHVNSAAEHATYVGLQNAAPGTWRVELLPGSPAVTSTGRAADPPAARVTGTVSGSDSARVLRYEIGARPAQRVTFYDVSPSGARKAIGTATSGAGTFRFTPAPGGGRHTILAAFELDGIAAEEKTVTRFTPPPATLPTPTGLRVARTGSRLAVSWAGVRGATSYELAVTTASGRQVFRTVKARQTTITGIAKTTSGTVTVRAAAPLRHSRVARRPFRATQATTRRLSALRRCSVKGKRVSCRR